MDKIQAALHFLIQLVLHPGDVTSQQIGPFIHGIVVDQLGAPEFVYVIVVAFILSNVMAGFVSVSAFWLIWMERRVCARFQNRIGPNRVGPQGLLQTIADAVKLLQKEDLIPTGADRLIFILAPFVCFAPVYMVLAVIPFDKGLSVTDLNIGMLYITAVSGMGVLSIVMAGWSSNNKYSLLGGLRSAAQIVSYELSPALVVLSVVLFTGTLSTQGIVEAQAHNWNIFAMGPMGLVGLLIYLTASTAEINRAPFDMPEAESELTAGFSTEYSGMRFSMFYLAEFINMFIVSALLAAMFLGGWQPIAIFGHRILENIPGTSVAIPGYVWFFLKTYAVIFVIMWFRWTFPRVRVDQLMKLEWKILLPISFVNLLAVAVFMAFNWAK
jgi:NADH-quinone oxidoreductase subunit H